MILKDKEIGKPCENCSVSLASQQSYCFNCGQKADSLNRPFREIAAESFHESLDIDGRLMLTLKTLFFSPGKLTREYNSGKRVKYTPPLRMYLILSILFFLIISQFDLSSGSSTEKLEKLYNYVPKMMFMLLPTFAILLQLLFRSTFYLGNLIFALHLHCIGYIIMAVLLPLETIENRHTVLQLLQIPLVVYFVFYIALAIKENYRESWLNTVTKALVLVFSYIAIIAISIEFIVSLIS